MNEAQRKNLARLDVMEGTGIFTENSKVDSVDQPTVIISLGGLGGKTLNHLKRQLKRRVNKENNSIRLLAIDSADRDLDNYDALEDEEKLSLYDISIPGLITNEEVVPANIKKWKRPNYLPKLSGEGCGGIRQNGRFILSAPAVYQKVRKQLYKTIKSARDAVYNPNARTNIIFIAGISGGTGSGTFIDMAYLVQDILLTEIQLQNRQSFKMSAYLYMPDVQYSVNGATIDSLKRNGYAALKELDYYYNLDKVGGVYKWPFAEGDVKNSKSRIYDFCSLVSSATARGEVTGNPETVAINVTVESLMAVITNAALTNAAGDAEQILTSFLDNGEDKISGWMTGNGSDPNAFPRSANYCYNIIGYGSAKIPVDAIMSYMAFKMYEELLAEYLNMDGLTPEYISSIMTYAGMGDLDSIIRGIKETASCAYITAEVPAPGDIHGLKGSYKVWKNKAYEHYMAFKTTQQFKNAITTATENFINRLVSRLETTFDDFGPYYVVRAITATQASYNLEGVLQRIDRMRELMIREFDERKQEISSWQQLEARLDRQAVDVPSMFGKEKAENFLRVARNTIEKYTIEMEILAAMVEKLVDVRNNLVEKNNRVFDVYTEVLDYIKDKLSANSDLVVNTSLTKHKGGGATYSLDVVNLASEEGKANKLKQCVDSFLTTEFVNQFKDSFKIKLRDPKNRPAFTDEVDNFNAASVIQSIFDDLLGDYYKRAVERFLIAFYSKDPDINNSEKLESVMNNEEQRKTELKVAADAICAELSSTSGALCQIVGAPGIDIFATPHRYMCVPAIVGDVFDGPAKTFIDPNINICKREKAFSIDVVTNYIGIPLTMIHGINDCDRAYDAAIKNDIVGIHLDESADSDFRKLPAPFVYEAWKLVSVGHESSIETDNVANVKKVVDRLKELNLIVANDDEAKNNARVINYFENEITDEFIAKMTEQAKVEVTSEAVADIFVKNYLAQNGVALSELSLAMVNDYGLPATLDNVYIIVRKNMPLFKKLCAFLANYEKINAAIGEVLKAIGGASNFRNNVTEFTNLMKAGMIKYNKGARAWMYNDGIMDKVMYNFGMKTPFCRTYNLFFAFAEYLLSVEPAIKQTMLSLATEKFNNMQVNYDMPEEIKAEIATLYSPGTPDTAKYLLDRELNKITINQEAATMPREFGIELPSNEGHGALYAFYDAFKANF